MASPVRGMCRGCCDCLRPAHRLTRPPCPREFMRMSAVRPPSSACTTQQGYAAPGNHYAHSVIDVTRRDGKTEQYRTRQAY
ncbi:uncharacterized protein TRAVEDRAFT_75746, partial [Trametes versicolor FP-101664 SS1]